MGVMRRLRRTLVLATILAVAGGIFVTANRRPAVAGPSSYTFFGGGFGHGVGMSQYGAQGMALRGVGYGDILRKYYTGTAIQTQPQNISMRIHLADDTGASPGGTVTAGADVQVIVQGVVRARATAGQTVRINVVNGQFNILVNGQQVAGPVGGGGDHAYVEYASDNPNHTGSSGPILLDKSGRRYNYGALEFSAISTGLRIVLVDITMQKYLFGLGEVPSSWPRESLRAQAVAARTYGKDKDNRLGQNRTNCSCGLFSSVSDQNYIGYDKETAPGGANWVAAVNDTLDQVVTYNGTAIQAFYSSSSGGYTEHSENVFVESLPYLRGVPDPDDAANNPNSKWTRTYSRDEMQRYLNRFTDTNAGTLDRVEIVPPLGVSGRVNKVIDDSRGGIRIVGSAGTKRVSGDRLRQVVNSGVAAEGGGLSRQLLSTLFRFGGWDAFAPFFTGGVYVGAGVMDTSGQDRVVVGAGQSGGPHVRVFDRDGGVVNDGFYAYAPAFSGGVRVAVCDLYGDGGTDEIVTAPGPGGGPHIRIFTRDGNPIGGGFMAYSPNFTGGVYVGCGDLDNDGDDEIITGAGAGGGPHVRLFRNDGAPYGEGFFAYDPRFTGGVRVAGARVDGPSAVSRLITAPGPGGGPHVRLFSDSTGTPVGGGFMAYAPSFTGGVYVGGGNAVGDGTQEIVTGAGEAGGAHVRIFNGAGADVVPGFAAFDTGNEHGARVAVGTFGAPGVVAGSGTESRPLVRTFTF